MLSIDGIEGGVTRQTDEGDGTLETTVSAGTHNPRLSVSQMAPVQARGFEAQSVP